jgi:ABC-type sugar transport system ATPase subunit
VKPGESVAIVGATGSGKTTVARLIPRFYEVDGGRVVIDGVDVRDVKVPNLRQSVGIVFEDTFLFSDSIRSNISFADPVASHFGTLAVSSVNGVNLATDVTVAGEFSEGNGTPLTIFSGLQHTLRVGATDVDGMIFDRVNVAVNSKVNALAFDQVTFVNQDPSVIQLSLAFPGLAGPAAAPREAGGCGPASAIACLEDRTGTQGSRMARSVEFARPIVAAPLLLAASAASGAAWPAAPPPRTSTR